jgi:hypothetical protein
MFKFKLQKWFHIFLELIEFPTNFRSLKLLGIVQIKSNGK